MEEPKDETTTPADDAAMPAEGAAPMSTDAPEGTDAEAKPEGAPKKGLLASDPQMSAALLLLRLQLADAGVAQG